MNFIFGIVILTVINNCGSKNFSTHNADDKNLNDKSSKEKGKQDEIFPFGIVLLNKDDTLLSKRSVYKIPIDKIKRNCACGQVINRKIVGGKDTAIKNHPWTAQLASKSDSFSHLCGGSVISTRHVISSAHCVKGRQPGNLLIRLGKTRSNFNEEGYDVQETRIHHRYKHQNRKPKFDIAILVTTRIIIFNNQIQPICLPGPFQRFNNKPGIIAGWGDTKEGDEKGSLILQEADVTILEKKSCLSLSSHPPKDLNDKVVCGRAEGKDTCKGDSGGPLVYKGAQNYILVGITSWGRGCARKELPGVYTSVARYVNQWIARNTRNEGLFCSRAHLKNPNK